VWNSYNCAATLIMEMYSLCHNIHKNLKLDASMTYITGLRQQGMLKCKAVDNKALTCGVIWGDGLKRAREFEGLKMGKLPEYEGSVGPTDHRTSAFTTQPLNSCVKQLGPSLEDGGGGWLLNHGSWTKSAVFACFTLRHGEEAPVERAATARIKLKPSHFITVYSRRDYCGLKLPCRTLYIAFGKSLCT
jgi:hypothetical protein